MKYVLLISGYKSAGKTETTRLIKRMLEKAGYKVTANKMTGQPWWDKIFLITGKNTKGRIVNIVINTASDDDEIINNLDEFLASNPYDIIITAIRDCKKERNAMLKMIDKYTSKDDFRLEIPLVKIKKKSLRWYKNTLEKLIGHILRSNPFDLNV